MRPSWKTAQRSLARVWSRRDCQLPCLAAPPVTWGESVVLLSKLVPSPVNWSRSLHCQRLLLFVVIASGEGVLGPTPSSLLWREG